MKKRQIDQNIWNQNQLTYGSANACRNVNINSKYTGNIQVKCDSLGEKACENLYIDTESVHIVGLQLGDVYIHG